MPLPFSLVCDLLESSYKLSLSRKNNAQVVTSWFTRHRHHIHAHDTNLEALLSTLLPEKRTDRVYCIQAKSLEKIIGRAFFLGASRIAELSQYRQPGLCIDLADGVARLLTVTPNPSFDKKHQVTVEEIDDTLHSLASRVKWSSPAIRASQSTLTSASRRDLEILYRRFNALEAKWFTRLVLKDYQPLVFEPFLIYRLCDSVLPSVLKIHDDFTTAIKAVQIIRRRLLPNTAGKISREQLLRPIKPQIGVKVGRQQWLKGRSIKHCLDMGHGRMSVEDKIDGEYCQVHIDLSKGNQCVQIFSKSGKDSTEDRVALHGVIKESLKIGKPDVKFRQGCILEAELVVYDDYEHKILPFHKIRRHVSRRGRFLNTEQDSLPGPHEHLMIIYYDILLLDDQSFINTRHSERFMALSKLVFCRTGWAELVHREIIDFGHSMGASNLRKAFARVILSRKEGLVLKPDDSYFDFSEIRRPFSSSCIKLKKEYIGNFGDVGDFAVVGARYDATKASTYRIAGLRWTHFYIGCLDNREQVKAWNANPEFTVVNAVELNEMMLRDVVSHGNHASIPFNENDQLILKLTPGIEQGKAMDVVFLKPLVFDLRCFSFDNVGNTGFWSLRFPSVTKVHYDRDFTDTVSFEQLQEMAKASTSAKELEDSQENLQWIAKLEAADPRDISVDALSQLTMTTMPTPSPRRSSQNSVASWSPISPTVAKKSIGRMGSPSRALFDKLVHSPANKVGTPLTSSKPDDTPLANEKAHRQKRLSSSRESPSQCKRWKSEALTQSESRKTSKQAVSQTRKPLAHINGNSQCSTISFSSSSPALEEYQPEVVDLTSSPDASFTTAATTRVHSSQTTRPSSPAEGHTTLTIPDSEELDTGGQNPASEKAGVAEMTIMSDCESKRAGPSHPFSSPVLCKYAGFKCSLSKTMILLSELGTDNEREVQDLLSQHGAGHTTLDADTWMRREETRARQNEEDVAWTGRIWLVDSVDAPVQTRDELKRFEQRRRALPKGKRERIIVYDWRVLRYLTIKEDDSIEKKYYDGWHDPWRRWYCGIV